MVVLHCRGITLLLDNVHIGGGVSFMCNMILHISIIPPAQHDENLHPTVCTFTLRPSISTDFVDQTKYIKRFCYIAKNMHLDKSFQMH